MIEFLKENYQISLLIIGVALDIILAIVVLFRSKKSTASDSIKLIIDEALPGFIRIAEASGCDGQSKLAAVIQLAMKRIRSYISSKDEAYYIAYIREKIESILSTPQKKEKSDA